MLVSVAFAPDTPLLVPQVAGSRQSDLDAVRSSAASAVLRMLGALPDAVVVIGEGPTARGHPGADLGSLAAFGVDVRVALGATTCGGSESLPPALTVGAWLIAEARRDARGRSFHGEVQAFEVPSEASHADVETWASELEQLPGRIGVLAMGSGSACLGPRSPGGADPTAGPFDGSVAAALAQGNPGALADLDVAVASRLLVSGGQTWRLVGRACAARDWAAGDWAAGDWDARLDYDAAPFGVGYLVASWVRRPGRSVSGVVT